LTYLVCDGCTWVDPKVKESNLEKLITLQRFVKKITDNCDGSGGKNVLVVTVMDITSGTYMLPELIHTFMKLLKRKLL
jgi:hypothetical protein